jgi:hypothetical protein
MKTALAAIAGTLFLSGSAMAGSKYEYKAPAPTKSYSPPAKSYSPPPRSYRQQEYKRQDRVNDYRRQDRYRDQQNQVVRDQIKKQNEQKQRKNLYTK